MSNEIISIDLKQPQEMAEIAQQAALKKVKRSPSQAFLLAILSGVFIAVGSVFFITVTTSVGSNASIGLVKMAGGLAFSTGLILCIVLGTDLFTSTVLSVVPKASGLISWGEMIGNWIIVYIGNFVGSLIFLFFMWFGRETTQFGDQWGLNVMNVALSKVSHGWWEALCLGILCNIMVCLAVWLTFSARTLTDKLLAVILPITMFVAAGFEHSVANMFMIPMGIITHAYSPDSYFQALGISADQFQALTWGNFIVNNLIPVTIGNIIGGGILVGLSQWLLYLRKK